MELPSTTLLDLLNQLRAQRDSEVSMAAEVLPQYVTDHNNKAAYRQIDRQVNALARAWDRMIALIERTQLAAEKIEASCENFNGQ